MAFHGAFRFRVRSLGWQESRKISRRNFFDLNEWHAVVWHATQFTDKVGQRRAHVASESRLPCISLHTYLMVSVGLLLGG